VPIVLSLRRERRFPLPAVLAVVILAIALGAGGWWYWRGRPAPEPAGARPVAATSTPPAPVSAEEQEAAGGALEALLGIHGILKEGLTYEDYAARVLDAQVQVNRYLNSPAAASPDLRDGAHEAMELYVFASRVWDGRNKNQAAPLAADRALDFCPALRSLVEKVPERPPMSLEESRGMVVVGNLPMVWSCAHGRVLQIQARLGP
jgi:hypothetical protein